MQLRDQKATMAKMKATMAGLLNADKQEQKKLKAVCSLAMTASASLIYLLGLSQTLFCSLAISSVSPRCFTLFPHRWFLILAACLFFFTDGHEHAHFHTPRHTWVHAFSPCSLEYMLADPAARAAQARGQAGVTARCFIGGVCVCFVDERVHAVCTCAPLLW